MTKPMLNTTNADAIVEAMFKWFYDSPIPIHPPEALANRKSMIAAIVCDAVSADITNQPLHDAYARAKAKRGIA